MYVDKVAIRKDILESQAGGIEISMTGEEDIQQELDLAKERWGLVGVMIW